MSEDVLWCSFGPHGVIFSFFIISGALQHLLEHKVAVIAIVAANIDYRNRYYYFSKPSNMISFDFTVVVVSGYHLI